MDQPTEVEVAGGRQEAAGTQQALLPTNALIKKGGNAHGCSARPSLSCWGALNAMPDSTKGNLIRRITKFEWCVVFLLLVIVIVILAINFAVSNVQQLPEERVQTIYVQSSVDQNKDPETQGHRPCDDGWIWYGNKCYYFSEMEGNWTVANDSCAALYSFLAVIDNQLELDFMMRRKGDSDHWIGLKKDSDGTWKWCNGTVFNNWFKIKDFSDCAFLNFHPIRSGECSNRRRWICTKVSSYKRRQKKRSPELKTQFLKEHFPKT